MSKKQTEPRQFEENMLELEHIIQTLEQGDLPLEQALAQFEKGVQLSRLSQEQLAKAEQRVQILLQQNDSAQLQPFNSSSGD